MQNSLYAFVNAEGESTYQASHNLFIFFNGKTIKDFDHLFIYEI